MQVHARECAGKDADDESAMRALMIGGRSGIRNSKQSRRKATESQNSTYVRGKAQGVEDWQQVKESFVVWIVGPSLYGYTIRCQD